MKEDPEVVPRCSQCGGPLIVMTSHYCDNCATVTLVDMQNPPRPPEKHLEVTGDSEPAWQREMRELSNWVRGEIKETCPHCNSLDLFTEQITHPTIRVYRVACYKCGYRGPLGLAPGEAAQQWNRDIARQKAKEVTP